MDSCKGISSKVMYFNWSVVIKLPTAERNQFLIWLDKYEALSNDRRSYTYDIFTELIRFKMYEDIILMCPLEESYYITVLRLEPECTEGCGCV